MEAMQGEVGGRGIVEERVQWSDYGFSEKEMEQGVRRGIVEGCVNGDGEEGGEEES